MSTREPFAQIKCHILNEYDANLVIYGKAGIDLATATGQLRGGIASCPPPQQC